MATFKDLNGKDWTLNISLGAFEEFQEATGKPTLLQDIFGKLAEHIQEDTEQIPLKAIVGPIMELFASIGPIGTLLYGCCVPLSQREAMPRDKFTHEVLAGVGLTGAIAALGKSVMEAAAAVPALLKIAGAGDSDPPSAGGTST